MATKKPGNIEPPGAQNTSVTRSHGVKAPIQNLRNLPTLGICIHRVAPFPPFAQKPSPPTKTSTQQRVRLRRRGNAQIPLSQTHTFDNRISILWATMSALGQGVFIQLAPRSCTGLHERSSFGKCVAAQHQGNPCDEKTTTRTTEISNFSTRPRAAFLCCARLR